MKTKKRKKTHVSFRINWLFIVVFLLFSALILRLGFVQIVYGENYKREVEKTEDETVDSPVPRGKMLDRYDRVIVDNKPLNAVTYTRLKGVTQEDKLKVAKKLATLIDVPVTTDVFGKSDKKKDKNTIKLTERDLKDYWIATHPKAAAKKITAADKQKVKEGQLSEDDLYPLQLKRITKNELLSVKDDLEVIAIKSKMEGGYALTAQIIKSGLTDKELAVISEQLGDLPGVDTTTYWDRMYTYDDLLSTLLGKITSADEGLPSENLQYYLSHGYSRNDRVGKSYLEKQYEDVLRGQKARVQNVTDRSGNLVSQETVTEGQRGSDLILTIDMELQKQVEDVLTKAVTSGAAGSRLMDRAFAIMMDPHTGDILAMGGKQLVTDKQTGARKVQDFALGNMTTSYEVGSAVKGATVLAGLDSGAIQPGTVFYDAPMKFGKTIKKSSHDMGATGIQKALEQSSNVFMYRTVLSMAGETYRPGGRLNIPPSIFNKLRSYYSQFGLGISTGIDLDNESTGIRNTVTNEPGKALDFSIGQYDTYTPLQLVQYISTIANGGYRMKPHLVKEIREPELDSELKGSIQSSFEPEVLNRITMSQSEIDIVKQGFRRVVTNGTGKALGNGTKYAKYNIAGKSGTAETFNKGVSVRNSTFVSYAPYDNPEVAVAVVIPSAYVKGSSNPLSKQVTGEVIKAYFDLKKEGEKEVEQKEEDAKTGNTELNGVKKDDNEQ
ncbi:penicillin-binding protein [Priestia megaterium]|uniref:peptidoglycan D,D-transpeptidase FtsI family protein n=1 Tax=Priestia TaxID=2800373 RepID=UPI000D508FBB|nr:penicillin-binding protein 2 [Priestia megaterium]MBU8855033.1 penicillin-binding protein 2 [Bacillus sp. FJAT-26377]PVC68827.1 penicillin-binding protein [Priestia megaterium]